MLFEGPWYFARTGMEGFPHFKMIGLAEIAALMMEHSHMMEKKSAFKNYEANRVLEYWMFGGREKWKTSEAFIFSNT